MVRGCVSAVSGQDLPFPGRRFAVDGAHDIHTRVGDPRIGRRVAEPGASRRRSALVGFHDEAVLFPELIVAKRDFPRGGIVGRGEVEYPGA